MMSPKLDLFQGKPYVKEEGERRREESSAAYYDPELEAGARGRKGLEVPRQAEAGGGTPRVKDRFISEVSLHNDTTTLLYPCF